MKHWFFLLCFLLISGVLTAQTEDEGTIDDIIVFNQPETATITEAYIFDVWRFQGVEGDIILAEMQASDGLAPLIGVRNPAGDVIASTDFDENGNALPPAEPNSTVSLQYTIESSGQYALVATRAGRLEGTTEGSYTITLSRIQDTTSDLQAVEFRCGRDIVRTVATLEFSPNIGEEDYRVRVYGFDGFQPAIRVQAGTEQAVDECAADPSGAMGDTAIWDEEITYEPDSPYAASFRIGGGELLEDVTLTLAGSAPGRYMAIISGFNLAGIDGAIRLRMGPASLGTEMLVYMTKDGVSRIDPVIYIPQQGDTLDRRCDDAGRLACDDIPALTGLGAHFMNGESIIGTAFDAGIRFSPDDVNRILIEFMSNNPNAMGNYAIVIFGELPETGE